MRGGRGLGWSAGRVRVGSVGVQGGFRFCGCGAGADKKFPPVQDSGMVICRITEGVHGQRKVANP